MYLETNRNTHTHFMCVHIYTYIHIHTCSHTERERCVHLGKLNFATRGSFMTIFRFVRAQGEEAKVTKMCVCVGM